LENACKEEAETKKMEAAKKKADSGHHDCSPLSFLGFGLGTSKQEAKADDTSVETKITVSPDIIDIRSLENDTKMSTNQCLLQVIK